MRQRIGGAHRLRERSAHPLIRKMGNRSLVMAIHLGVGAAVPTRQPTGGGCDLYTGSIQF